jgi:alpha-amylase
MKAQKLIRKGIMCILGLVLAVSLTGCSGTTGSSSESASVTAVSRSVSSTTTSDKSGVMLQGFNWASATESSSTSWYQTMINNADAIKSEFAYVWFPPPSLAVSSEGYLPTQLNDLNSEYGTETQLKAAISAISPAKAIADIVINHRCGSTDWGDFTNPKWNDDFYSICSDDEGFSSSSAMMASSKRGNADTGDGYSAGRDLDHTNTDVQNGIITWMTGVLKADGFVGWRYDFVKGYAGYYVGKYDAATSAGFSVGEYWPSDTFNSSNWESEIMSWINATETGGYKSRAFDFVLKGNLNYAFGYKDNLTCWNMSLLADSNNLFRQAPSYAVTFIDNHDTGSTQNLWSIDPGDLGPAYAFILTHPGYPCVAWQHYFTGSTSQYKGGMSVSGTSYTLQQHINKLISIRQEAGVCYDSAISVLAATTTLYVAQITGETKTLIVKIGGDSYTPSGDYTNVYSGTNFAVWEGSGSSGSSVTLSATYDAGYGNALYFTGSFTEGNSWTTAVRGTWSTGNVWTASVTVPSAGSFEWKVMKGSYSLGSSVSTSASGLTWSSNSNASYPGTTSVTPSF